MNILFLSRLYAPHVGGVEKHLFEISKRLSLKHHISIVTEQFETSLPLVETTREAVIYRIPSQKSTGLRKKLEIWRWFFKNRHLIHNADIIHVHDVFFWLLPFLIFYPNKKIFITFHGYEGIDQPTFRQKLMHQLLAKFSNGNICIGAFHSKWYTIKPDIISYGGVSAKTVMGPKKTDKLIFIGRLAEDTGIIDYLRALSAKKLSLDVFGDGPLSIHASRLSHKMKLAVKYHGFVPEIDKRLPQYSLAFVSRYLAILEALAARVPVVAHYNNSIKFDYLSNTPFKDFIKICGSPEELSVAIDEIQENQVLREKMVKEGYNWAVGQTWEKLVSDYEKLWRKRYR